MSLDYSDVPYICSSANQDKRCIEMNWSSPAGQLDSQDAELAAQPAQIVLKPVPVQDRPEEPRADVRAVRFATPPTADRQPQHSSDSSTIHDTSKTLTAIGSSIDEDDQLSCPDEDMPMTQTLRASSPEPARPVSVPVKSGRKRCIDGLPLTN